MLSYVQTARFRLGLFLLLSLLLAVVPCHAASLPAKDKSVTKEYKLAQARYNTLQFSARLAKDRQNWLLCAKALQRAYQLDPYHPSAPNILFSQGELYFQMYKKFGSKEDLNEALSFYDDVVTLFPQHSLADDALYRAAITQADEVKDSKNASLLLAKLIAVYPKGDMTASAITALQKLKVTISLAHPASPAKKSVQAPAAPTPETGKAPAPIASDRKRPIQIVSLRHWSTESYTRVVIETSAPVTFKGHLLTKDSTSPKRLYVDLTKCAISRDLQQAIPIKDGLLQRMRSAQFDPTTVRVVLDTLAIADYKIFNLDNPFRIIVDVKGTLQAKLPPLPQTAETKAPPPPAKTRVAIPPPTVCAKNPSLAQQLGLGIKRVVLDPGHGGKDPGAIGINGLREKDIVLTVAKKVARKIATKMGIEVVLTRKTDIFIPLEERTAIANTKSGDLFISIHVNAAPSSQVEGIETYYLDLATNEEDRGLAALENASSSRQISDLQNILSSLMQNSKKDESARLAGLMQKNLVSGLCATYPGITNHGVKTAPFIVLIGAQMPSILTEIAFISNQLESKRLQDDLYLEALADHITDGVISYSSSLTMARL